MQEVKMLNSVGPNFAYPLLLLPLASHVFVYYHKKVCGIKFVHENYLRINKFSAARSAL